MTDHDQSEEALHPGDKSKHSTSGEGSEKIEDQQGSSAQVTDPSAMCHQLGATAIDTGEEPTAQQDATAVMDEAGKAPTLALLYLARTGFESHNPEVLMAKIMSSIRERFARLKNTCGRTPDYFRINYDPDASDITGIQRHLSDDVLNREFAENPDYEKLDVRLCQPLINSNWVVFLKSKKLTSVGKWPYHKLWETEYRSCWDHHKHVLDKFHPFSWSSREEVIAAVVESVRSRCKKAHPQSLLLIDPDHLMDADTTRTPEELERVREWSLYDIERGFGAKLRINFEREDLAAEQYEELIERTMYEFKMKNKDAVYGPKDGSEYRAKLPVEKKVLPEGEWDGGW